MRKLACVTSMTASHTETLVSGYQDRVYSIAHSFWYDQLNIGYRL